MRSKSSGMVIFSKIDSQENTPKYIFGKKFFKKGRNVNYIIYKTRS